MSTTASNVFYNNNNAAKPFRSSAAAQSTSMLPNSSLHHNVFATSSEGPVFAAPSTTPSAASLSSTNQHGFSPYDLNGGTVAAVAGPDYVVVAADTRLSSGYEILCRDSSKLFGLVHSSQCVLASSGCKTDVDQLRSLLNIKMKIYNHNHRKDMPSDSVAQLLSNTLYYKRFFPYYAFNILAGMDANGAGAVYSYDAIGSFERTAYSANGSGQAYIIPVLDNVIGNRNRTDDDNGNKSGVPVTLSADEVVEILKDTFLSAGERDIYTGDAVEIMVVTQDSIVTHRFALKAD